MDTNMTAKKQPKPTDSFHAFSQFVREEVGNELYLKNIKYIMDCYIAPIHVDKCIDTIKGGKEIR